MKPQPCRLRRELLTGITPWKPIQLAWGLEENVARLAWLRGVDNPSELRWRLEPEWESTFEPYGLENMGKAVTRIKTAIANREKIIIYGDYDVDGVTATALLVRVLERMNADVTFFIPNRFSDGYGLHTDCIKELAQTRSPKLIISVDCGIRSVGEVSLSRELGIDWVITDHHTPGDESPAAVAILHPSLGEQKNKHLSGVGVAFKLAQALIDAVPVPKGSDASFLDGLLKLVAIGTIADIVPLVQENALLVRRGLIAMRGQNSPGLSSLLKAARCEGHVSAQTIAFGVGPRINAVGRMGGAEDAVRLLLSKDTQEAETLMKRIEQLNKDRRECQRKLALSLPPAGDDYFDLVVEPTAHKGVIGIVASHRMRDNGRPSGVCTVTDGVAQCSLRALEPYDLSEMLALARPFLLSGGGHKTAAGVSFDMSHFVFVKEIFTRAAKSQTLTDHINAVEVDGSSIDCIPSREALERLEPFGQSWPEPVVAIKGYLSAAPDSFGAGHWRIKLRELSQSITWFFARGKFSEPPIVGQALMIAVSPQDHPRWGRSWRAEALLEGEVAS